MIIVIGAGISGLAFCISYLSSTEGKGAKVVVFESGANDDSRRGSYSHSISLRDDIGGLSALEKLGVFEQLLPLKTNSKGAMVVNGKSLNVVLSTEWLAFGRTMRFFRYDIWRLLLEKAISLGAEIHFNSSVIKVNPSPNSVDVLVRLKKNEREEEEEEKVYQAEVVVAADGANSTVRSFLCSDLPDKGERSFLQTVIVGGTLPNETEVPKTLLQHHAIIFNEGVSMFIADEGEGKVLVSIAFPWPSLLDRSQSQQLEQVKEHSLLLSQRFPQLQGLVKKVWQQPIEKLLLLNCRDRLPLPPKGRVVFIGDASHAVSPYGGSGANMALLDGLILGRILGTSSSLKGESSDVLGERWKDCLDEFCRETHEKWVKNIEDQRKRISFMHNESFKTRVVFKLLSLLPFVFSPAPFYRMTRLLTVSLMIGAGTAIAYKMFQKFK